MSEHNLRYTRGLHPMGFSQALAEFEYDFRKRLNNLAHSEHGGVIANFNARVPTTPAAAPPRPASPRVAQRPLENSSTSSVGYEFIDDKGTSYRLNDPPRFTSPSRDNNCTKKLATAQDEPLHSGLHPRPPLVPASLPAFGTRRPRFECVINGPGSTNNHIYIALSPASQPLSGNAALPKAENGKLPHGNASTDIHDRPIIQPKHVNVSEFITNTNNQNSFSSTAERAHRSGHDSRTHGTTVSGYNRLRNTDAYMHLSDMKLRQEVGRRDIRPRIKTPAHLALLLARDDFQYFKTQHYYEGFDIGFLRNEVRRFGLARELLSQKNPQVLVEALAKNAGVQSAKTFDNNAFGREERERAEKHSRPVPRNGHYQSSRIPARLPSNSSRSTARQPSISKGNDYGTPLVSTRPIPVSPPGSAISCTTTPALTQDGSSDTSSSAPEYADDNELLFATLGKKAHAIISGAPATNAVPVKATQPLRNSKHPKPTKPIQSTSKKTLNDKGSTSPVSSDTESEHEERDGKRKFDDDDMEDWLVEDVKERPKKKLKKCRFIK